MKAEEARRLTNNAIEKKIGIESILDLIYKKIKSASEKGENTVIAPFDMRSQITYEQKKRVIENLRKDGYKFTESTGEYNDFRPEYLSW